MMPVNCRRGVTRAYSVVRIVSTTVQSFDIYFDLPRYQTGQPGEES